MPPWDMAELGRDSEPEIGSVATTKPDCSVDLKLGGLGDFEASDKWKELQQHHHQQQQEQEQQHQQQQLRISMSTPTKRARAMSNGSQNVSCLVDGCKSDLSNCREYHRRHKVCEVHSKTPMVMVGGQEQRFCQQCSRYNSTKDLLPNECNIVMFFSHCCFRLNCYFCAVLDERTWLIIVFFWIDFSSEMNCYELLIEIELKVENVSLDFFFS